MNTIMNMDPFRILDELFNMKGPAYRNMRARAAGRFPPVNVFLDDNAVLIDLELPGKVVRALRNISPAVIGACGSTVVSTFSIFSVIFLHPLKINRA